MASMKPVVTLMNLMRVVKQAKLRAHLTGTPVAVGMGSSGPFDLENQLLQDGDSLPNLLGFDIGRFCWQEFDAPFHLENDVACFAVSEAVYGAGRGCEIVPGVTLGTGFGCGISINGRIYSGATNNAGEVAYCPVDDSDSDAAGSGNGVVQQYLKHSDSAVSDSITAKRVGGLAEQGSETVRNSRWDGHRDILLCVGSARCGDRRFGEQSAGPFRTCSGASSPGHPACHVARHVSNRSVRAWRLSRRERYRGACACGRERQASAGYVLTRWILLASIAQPSQWGETQGIR